MQISFRQSQIFYETYGEGDAIVLLHGFLETSAMWAPLISEFKLTHQVICIDLPGHGQSECLSYIHTMEDMAKVVLAVLNFCKIEEAAFIGHSMGGYVALALAAQQPGLVIKLCLMNSTFEADSLERKANRERAIAMAKRNYDNLVKLSFSNLFAPESRITFKHELEKALELALQTPVQGYIAAQIGMSKRQPHKTTFLNVPGPKALVIGQKDNLVDTAHLKTILQNEAVEICELSGGHMSHIENTCDLTYFLLRFI